MRLGWRQLKSSSEMASACAPCTIVIRHLDALSQATPALEQEKVCIHFRSFPSSSQPNLGTAMSHALNDCLADVEARVLSTAYKSSSSQPQRKHPRTFYPPFALYKWNCLKGGLVFSAHNFFHILCALPTGSIWSRTIGHNIHCIEHFKLASMFQCLLLQYRLLH